MTHEIYKIYSSIASEVRNQFSCFIFTTANRLLFSARHRVERNGIYNFHIKIHKFIYTHKFISPRDLYFTCATPRWKLTSASSSRFADVNPWYPCEFQKSGRKQIDGEIPIMNLRYHVTSDACTHFHITRVYRIMFFIVSSVIGTWNRCDLVWEGVGTTRF